MNGRHLWKFLIYTQQQVNIIIAVIFIETVELKNTASMQGKNYVYAFSGEESVAVME